MRPDPHVWWTLSLMARHKGMQLLLEGARRLAAARPRPRQHELVLGQAARRAPGGRADRLIGARPVGAAGWALGRDRYPGNAPELQVRHIIKNNS